MDTRNRKKITLSLIFILVFIPCNFYGLNLDFSWDAGDIFVNGQMDMKNNVDFFLNSGSRVGEIIFKQKDSGLQLSINPFYWNCENHFNPNNTKNSFSFINLQLFFDFFHFDKANDNFGLYTSINYLDLVNMTFSSYQVDVGILYSHYPNISNNFFFTPESVTIRSGFRVKNNIPSVYIESSFNLASLIQVFLNSYYEEAQNLKNSL